MPKSRVRTARPKTRWSLIIILLLACALTYVGYKYFFPKPQSSNIFVVTTPTLQYGNTTLTGRLQKDSPMGETGNYLLILPDGRPVLLDSKNLDPIIGLNATVSGILSPASQPGAPMMMIVKEISAQ